MGCKIHFHCYEITRQEKNASGIPHLTVGHKYVHVHYQVIALRNIKSV